MFNKLKKHFKIFFVFALLSFICIGNCFSVSAATNNDTAYQTYSYRQYDNSKTPITAKPMFVLDRVVSGTDLGIGKFSSLDDVCCDREGNAYLMDSLNSRVAVIDKNGSYKCEIKNLYYNNELLDFTGAKGVFVGQGGTVYIADSMNARVIIVSKQNTVSRILELPDSNIIPEDFQYSPVKVAVDSKGYIYILSSGSYYGALLYNPDYEFCGFFGSNSVKTSVATFFENIKDAIFQSNEKLSSSARELPFSFNDLTIRNDFIFTVTGASVSGNTNESTGQISKFSPGGTNILKANTGKTVVGSDSYSFQDKGYFEGIFARTNIETVLETDFVGIDVDENEFIYAVDGTYGKVFIYDKNCNYVNIFGIGHEEGKQKGTFIKPSSIAVSDDFLYVTDSSKNALTIFKKTEYGKLLSQAQSSYLRGDYEFAKPIFEKIIKMDRNCTLAYRGVAKALFLEGDYNSAMEYSELGFDQVTYAQAFEKVRNEKLTDNFIWVFLSILLVLGVMVFLIVYTNKKGVKIIKNRKINIALSSMVHPFDSYKEIHYMGGGSILIATVIMVVYYASVVLSNVYVGFSFGIFNQDEFNSLYTLFSNVGVILLWSVANFAICSLMSGKARLKEIYIVTTYALLPQIIMNFLKLFLTNVLVPSEAAFLDALSKTVLIFTGFLLAVAIMTVQEYDFSKFVGTTVVTLIAMFLIVFIIFMICTLFQQAGNFIVTIVKELLSR